MRPDMGSGACDATYWLRRRPPVSGRAHARSGALLLGVVVADFLDLGVDHAVVGRGLALGAALGGAALGLVHGLAQLHRGLDQGVGPGPDVLGILARAGGLEILERGLDG